MSRTASPLAQLLLRHETRWRTAPPALWFNPPVDLSPDLVAAGALCVTQHEAQRLRLDQHGIEARLAATPPRLDPPGCAIFVMPREKALLRMMAVALAEAVGPGGCVYAVGEVRAGARSAAPHLECGFEHVRKIDSARHCVLYEAQSPRKDARFRQEDFFETWTLDSVTPPLTICSLPGVFAHGGLDAGTALLLETLADDRHAATLGLPRYRFEASTDHGTDPSPAGDFRALDVGCGAGVVGAALLRHAPQTRLLMTDSNALALESSRATLAANGLSAEVLASDGLGQVLSWRDGAGNGAFDLVISNPPFHDGHRERVDLGAGVFDGIGRLMAPGARLVIVVNRHLPWPQWLDETFGSHEVIARDRRYQVLLSRSGQRSGRVRRRG